MFRLTRQVRFAVNLTPDNQLSSPPSNSFGGFPSLTGAGQFFAIDVTVTGELEPRTSYLLNIKQVDEVVRQRVIPFVAEVIRCNQFGSGAGAVLGAFGLLRVAFFLVTVEAVRMHLTPFLSLEVRDSELPMVRLSQKFEFCASHRLHNPAFTDEQNRAAFGKCNYPHGHGHNYELEVTLLGEPDENGVIVKVPDFEWIVSNTIIDRFDHKNLNLEIPEFASLNPSVENIAKVIYHLLRPKFASQRTRLASVTVWETSKTWCEYSEET